MTWKREMIRDVGNGTFLGTLLSPEGRKLLSPHRICFLIIIRSNYMRTVQGTVMKFSQIIPLHKSNIWPTFEPNRSPNMVLINKKVLKFTNYFPNEFTFSFTMQKRKRISKIALESAELYNWSEFCENLNFLRSTGLLEFCSQGRKTYQKIPTFSFSE